MITAPHDALSRRGLSLAGLVAAATGALAIKCVAAASAPAIKGTADGNTITVSGGATLYFKDWGSGQPIVLSHGWPLNADAFEDQMYFLASQSYRCIAHDRRGHGRSSQSWGGNDMDTYADDLAAIVQALGLRNIVLVGHSTGAGEVARYIGRHGTVFVANVVLISSITPTVLKTAGNPGGVPIETFDGIRKAILADRSQFWKDLSLPFYGYNRPKAKVSEGVREAFWRQCMMAGFPASYLGLTPSSEVDLTPDLVRFNRPTLLLHGDDDQLVPLANSALRTAKFLRHATLKVYPGAPHGLPTTMKDRVNADLLGFIRQPAG